MTKRAETILVVDDEPQIRRFLRTSLVAHGYDVLEAVDGAEALRQATTGHPDLIVLDLGLPDMEGFDVLKKVREFSPVPVFILSVRSREGEKVKALDLGADDYITKPFGMAEFIARVRGAFRRRSREHIPQAVFTVGGLEVDVERRIVRIDGAEIRLSPTQYELLYLLVGNAGKVVTHQHLLREVWGPAHTEDVQYLRVFVRKLRSRIEADPARPRYLLTELGVGYRLRSPDQLPEQI
jgi:two-component system, OmpR family, KDP operon response regulator KdpE